jgi:transposase
MDRTDAVQLIPTARRDGSRGGFPRAQDRDSLSASIRWEVLMAVAITRVDRSAVELRREARCARSADQARRLLALALVLEGSSRTQAARSCGMDRQTLRDWVHRYNAEGIEGLLDRPTPGRAPRLTRAQERELAGIVERGPDLAADGVVRWRRVDLRRVIRERFAVAFHERSVGKLLAKLGYRRLSVRPQHPEADPQAQAAFKKTSPRSPGPRSRPMPPASRSRSGSRTRPGSARRAA